MAIKKGNRVKSMFTSSLKSSTTNDSLAMREFDYVWLIYEVEKIVENNKFRFF